MQSGDSGIGERGGSWLDCAGASRLLGEPSKNSPTSPASSSLAAVVVVQAFSTIARYGLEDKGLSSIAGGRCKGNIVSRSLIDPPSRSVKICIPHSVRGKYWAVRDVVESRVQTKLNRLEYYV